MKKLMIVAAIALAASFGYGASATWSVDWAYANITGYTNYDDGSANGTYWLIGLTSASTDGISVDKDGQITIGSGMTQLQTGGIGGISTGSSGSVAGVTANQYVALVVYDSAAVAGDYVGAYGIAVGQVSGDASDDPPVKGGIPVFANDAEGYVAANIGILGGSTPPGPGPIPEPTSGLLLVLGGAMLALRRKRG